MKHRFVPPRPASRGLLALVACLASLLPGLGARARCAEPALERYQFAQVHMGMPFEIILYAGDQESANTAAAAAFDRIGQLNGIMSDYDPESELSRLGRTAGQGRPVRVSPELCSVLSRAQRLAADTDGAFDVTVGPLVKLWRRARRTGQLPSPARLAAARQAVGYQKLRLDEAAGTAQLVEPHMRLDLGGIAAGYAADEALAVLARHGISRALVDASGDIVVGDPPPGAAGWRIGVAPLGPADAPPSRYLLLARAAVSTSGDAWQHVEIGGRRYSHILDPRTGMGLTDPSSVTVIAPDGVTADSLATAVSVVGPRAGLELVERTPGVAAFIVRNVAGMHESHQSHRFRDFEFEDDPNP